MKIYGSTLLVSFTAQESVNRMGLQCKTLQVIYECLLFRHSFPRLLHGRPADIHALVHLFTRTHKKSERRRCFCMLHRRDMMEWPARRRGEKGGEKSSGCERIDKTVSERAVSEVRGTGGGKRGRMKNIYQDCRWGCVIAYATEGFLRHRKWCSREVRGGKLSSIMYTRNGSCQKNPAYLWQRPAGHILTSWTTVQAVSLRPIISDQLQND